MAEANSQTADPSVRGVPISDLITRRIFAAASLFAAPKCADVRSFSGAAEVYAFYSPPFKTARHSPKSRVIIKPQVRPL
jgi:hypothetical protein